MLRPDADRDEQGSDRPGQAPFNVVSRGAQAASLVVSGCEAFGNCACAGKNVRCCPLIVQPEGHPLQRLLRTCSRSPPRRSPFARGSGPFAGPARAPRRSAPPAPAPARGRPERPRRARRRCPAPSRSCRIEAGRPRPAAASSSARSRANRPSSTAPARTSRRRASFRAAGAHVRSRKPLRRAPAPTGPGARATAQPGSSPRGVASSRRSRRARSRSSSTPTSRPAASTTSAGRVRHGSPFELDLDASARPSAQRANSWRRPSP